MVGRCLIFLLEAIGKAKVSTITCFFACMAAKGRICIDDVLKRRNFNRPVGFLVCFEEEEMVMSLDSITSTFVSCLDRCWMGLTFLHQRCCSGVEKKNEESVGRSVWKIVPLMG